MYFLKFYYATRLKAHYNVEKESNTNNVSREYVIINPIKYTTGFIILYIINVEILRVQIQNSIKVIIQDKTMSCLALPATGVQRYPQTCFNVGASLAKVCEWCNVD